MGGYLFGAESCHCGCPFPLCIRLEWDLLYTADGVDPFPDVTWPVIGNATIWVPSGNAEEAVRTCLDGGDDDSLQATDPTLGCDGSEVQGWYVAGDDADVAYSVKLNDGGECYRIGFYVYGVADSPNTYNARFLFNGADGHECEGLIEGDNVINLTLAGTPENGVHLTGTIRLTITEGGEAGDCVCE
jgi:hypothetical protein